MQVLKLFEMKRILSTLPLLTVSSPNIYETVTPEFPIGDLIATEAVGWALPIASEHLPNGPEVWFATDLGNYRFEIGPGSELAQRSLLQLSLNADNMIVMKVLKPGTRLDGSVGWSLLDHSSTWETNLPVEFDGYTLAGDSQAFRFDFTRDDIEFPSLEVFNEIWSPELVRSHKSRLLVSCTILENRGEFSLKIGDIPIPFHVLTDQEPELANLKNDGWCPLNVVVDAPRHSIGRIILKNNDVVLDGVNRRITLVPKSEITPNKPLMKYRLDPASPTGDPKSGSWRWIPSPGLVSRGDFVMTKFDANAYEFLVLCLVRPCDQHVLPSRGKLWVGAPTIDIESSGAITVTEKVGWSGFKITVYVESYPNMESVRITISKTGFRMKRDPASSIAGMRMEIVPVYGSNEPGEFSIPEWPPVFDQTSVSISYISWSSADELLLDNNFLRGKPKVEVQEGSKIVITAESPEDECDREIRLTATFPRGEFIDFSNEICNYRQIERNEAGYFFEYRPRSEASPDDFRFLIRGGSVTLYEFEVTFIISVNRPGKLWSPEALWFGTPVLAMLPNAKSFSITPRGEDSWEYSHVWEYTEANKAVLQFTLLPRRLTAPEGLLLTDRVWLFTSVAQGGFTVRKDGWMMKGAGEDFTLVFEDVKDRIFDGPQQGLFIGLPEVSFDDSDNLVVRSNGDVRVQFNVEIYPFPEGRLEIVFTLADYASVGSVPVQAGPDEDPCPICMEEYKPGTMMAETRCKHRFHLSCLRRVTQRRCPLCRGSLNPR